MAQNATQAPLTEHDVRDAGEDPGVEGTGRARLAVGRLGPKQAAGLRRSRPDATPIDDRAHRAAASDRRDHLLPSRDTAGTDRHGAAAGVTAQPGPVPPRSRASREGALAQQRRDAAAGPQSKVSPSRRVQALARPRSRSPRLAGRHRRGWRQHLCVPGASGAGRGQPARSCAPGRPSRHRVCRRGRRPRLRPMASLAASSGACRQGDPAGL